MTMVRNGRFLIPVAPLLLVSLQEGVPESFPPGLSQRARRITDDRDFAEPGRKVWGLSSD